ncbi:PTS system mannose/fructose/sorbose family transporter subunit IID [Clostridium baratii]|uniref:PTS system mannose/fructose/sorbose family transporter subunit IID n=1 Tax=Clostridium baratii TaxID=1561 RepID=UPI001DD7A9F7|nr:PTS system mannose/fructose/sorbose family transporter subunit IID [Clostridium baratii]MBT9831447.1 PTS mannose transporter subunit IID [Clostridium baratii]
MTMTSKDNDMNITKKDLMKVFWRSFSMEWSWNYERQANMSYAYGMIPIIKKLYKTDEERAEALKRHLEFFNTTPHISTLILGISTAMEESNAKAKDFDTSSINNVKVGLMGPLAGIGDSFFWGTLRVIATGIGTSLALQGNILGPILFLLVFNIPHLLVRYFAMMGGYKLGAGVLDRIQKSGFMESLTYGAAILGLMVIGGMTAEMVIVNIPLTIGEGDSAMAVADILNGIVPGIMSLGFTGFIYMLLGKNFKTTTILILIAAIGIIGAFFGILA